MPSMSVHTIIARPVPWPALRQRPDRAGLRLKWTAVCEETGTTLAEQTEYPLADGAHALTLRGVSGDHLVTLRHEGAEHPSFKPMPLRIPAARGAARAAKREALGQLRRTAAEREEAFL